LTGHLIDPFDAIDPINPGDPTVPIDLTDPSDPIDSAIHSCWCIPRIFGHALVACAFILHWRPLSMKLFFPF
jgi:hypothetical protein